jgi:hypothetical protein
MILVLHYCKHHGNVHSNVVIYRSGCHRREAFGLRSVVAPAVRQQRPPKWPRDHHALRRPAPGLRPLASAAFGHGDRLGILRVHGALVIHVVLEYRIIIIDLYWYCTLQSSVVQYCSTPLQYCSTELTHASHRRPTLVHLNRFRVFPILAHSLFRRSFTCVSAILGVPLVGVPLLSTDVAVTVLAALLDPSTHHRAPLTHASHYRPTLVHLNRFRVSPILAHSRFRRSSTCISAVSGVSLVCVSLLSADAAFAVVRPEAISQRVFISRGRTRAYWKALVKARTIVQ